jgi:hypothetical protein
MKRHDVSQEPGLASGCVLGGCWLIGLRIGEVLFRGARAGYVLRPWWYTAIFIFLAIVLTTGFRDTLIKVALALFSISEALVWFEGDNPTVGFEVVRTIVGFAMAMLLVAAGWRSARPWAKLTACVLLVAAVPMRYWVLQRTYGSSSVVSTYSIRPSNVPLQPTRDSRSMVIRPSENAARG